MEHAVLQNVDLLSRILMRMTRRDAANAARTCLAFSKAFVLCSERSAFVPRIIIGCSRLARVLGMDLTCWRPSQIGHWKQRGKGHGSKQAAWITGMAVHEGDIYVCEYLQRWIAWSHSSADWLNRSVQHLWSHQIFRIHSKIQACGRQVGAPRGVS